MGEVYVARQVTLGRLVALKFLIPDWDDPECDSARFRREAELMAKVCHPNVLSLFDYGEADGRQYLAMEYIAGGDLRGRLIPGEPLPVQEVRSILRPVADALAFLHRQGIIHRDLKPENILLHDGCTPLVTDFGIATLREVANESPMGAPTNTGRGVGTLGYVAPEQQFRLKVDERADQYSLAAMAYEMLTGHLPLGIFKAPSLLNPRLAVAVDGVVLRALREDPKDRFGSVKEFADALDVALVKPPTKADRQRSVLRRVVVPAVVGPAAALFLLVLIRPPMGGPPPGAPGFHHPPPRFDAQGRPLAPPFWHWLWPRPPHPPLRPELKDDRSPDPGLPGPLSASPPQIPPETSAAPAPLALDPLEEELKGIVAGLIWKDRGSLINEPGAAVQGEIWFLAVEQVRKTTEKIAFEIWKSRGCLRGPGEKEANWKAAQLRYYKSLTGSDYGKPRSEMRHTPDAAP